jgi:hypothetical protein
MYVQNGERPRWAWSGQHVEVASAWEIAPEAPDPGSDAGPPGVDLIGRGADRPSWAWGGERGAAPVASDAVDAAPIPEVVAGERPAWSWGGPAA